MLHEERTRKGSGREGRGRKEKLGVGACLGHAVDQHESGVRDKEACEG